MKPRRVIRSRKQSKPARHTETAHACKGERLLSIEPNPLTHLAGQEIVVERCLACERILDVRTVLPEPELVNNDDQDDCA